MATRRNFQRRVEAEPATSFLQNDRLFLLFQIRVVARRTEHGNTTYQSKTAAAANTQRRQIFGRSVRATPGSDDLDFGAKFFVLSSSTKPYNHFPFLTSASQVFSAKTVAAVEGCWPDFVADSGDIGGAEWSRRDPLTFLYRCGRMGGAGGGTVAAQWRPAVVRWWRES